MFLPPEFDKDIAIEAGELVQQAYLQHVQVALGGAWNLGQNYQVLATIMIPTSDPNALPGVFGFVVQRDTTLFVVFRGTQTINDWLADFNFPQKPDPFFGQGFIATGFSDYYDGCRATVRQAVQDAANAGAGAVSNVVVTGHSLGAALAILACADLATFLPQAGIPNVPPIAMYSFAGPRVGDPGFASAFNGLVTAAWRVVNTEDLVTVVPFATPLLLTLPPTGVPLIVPSMSLFGFAHDAIQKLNDSIHLLEDSVQQLRNLTTRLNYAHVGTAVSFTTHDGSITANHDITLYVATVRAGTPTRP